MYVEQLGTGEPSLAIVGGIHGDEPCGAQAIRTLLADAPPVTRPVKCIIANERALDQEMRSIDTDLNRAFPGEPAADTHERRLAAELLTELQGCTALSLHATQSYGQPFAIVESVNRLAMELCPSLSIDAVVEVGDVIEQGLGAYTPIIEIECGYQGTDQAATNAERISWEFLAAMGALPGTIPHSTTHPVSVYHLVQQVPKPAADTYAIHCENFERVEPGTPYASSDGTTITAEKPFYPVLMSPDGYETHFGYRAELLGPLDEPEQPPSPADPDGQHRQQEMEVPR
jgi:succinylglutamate desuccinylase